MNPSNTVFGWYFVSSCGSPKYLIPSQKLLLVFKCHNLEHLFDYTNLYYYVGIHLYRNIYSTRSVNHLFSNWLALPQCFIIQYIDGIKKIDTPHSSVTELLYSFPSSSVQRVGGLNAAEMKVLSARGWFFNHLRYLYRIHLEKFNTRTI